jgi:hypothetical protein
MHWGYAPPIQIIDNTNLARLARPGLQRGDGPGDGSFRRAYGLSSSAMRPNIPIEKRARNAAS